MRDLLDEFRKDFDIAMKELEQKYGLDITLGNITYSRDESSFNGKIQAVKLELGKTVQQIEFEKHADLYGFKPEDYKKEYIVKGKIYQLVGINPRAKKFPFTILDVSSNTEYTCNRDFLNDSKKVEQTDEEKEAERKRDFEFHAFKYGFKPEDYKKEFTIDNKIYQLVGFNSKARKNIYIIMDKETSKLYTCSRDALDC